MDTSPHVLQTLFQQLGLPAHAAAIDRFIATHRPVPAELLICDAPFWNTAQAGFLREGLAADGEWSELVDQLDAMLR